MGSGSSPSVGSVNTWDKTQKFTAANLAYSDIPKQFAAGQLSLEEALASLDPTKITNDFAKGVSAPMYRAFNTYAVPEITSGFRRGGLFSSARGNAIQRGLSDVSNTLATNLATTHLNATNARANILSNVYFNPSAGIQSALGLLSAKSREAVGTSGTASSDWLGAGTQLGSTAMLAMALA